MQRDCDAMAEAQRVVGNRGGLNSRYSSEELEERRAKDWLQRSYHPLSKPLSDFFDREQSGQLRKKRDLDEMDPAIRARYEQDYLDCGAADAHTKSIKANDASNDNESKSFYLSLFLCALSEKLDDSMPVAF